MAGNVITTGSFPAAVLPEGMLGYDKAIKEHPSVIEKIFEMGTMDKSYEVWYKTYGLGQAAVIGEGQAVSYDHMGQLWKKEWTSQKYGLAVAITEAAIRADREGIIYRMKGAELGETVERKRNLLAAAFLDGAFTSGNLSDTGDGKALIATDHPLHMGGTFKNRPTIYAEFSEAALEQAFIDIQLGFKNERGFREDVKPRKVVVGVNNYFEAERVFKSVGQVYTPDNTPNAIKTAGLFPEGVVVHPNMVSQKAWHVLTDVQDGLKYYTSLAPKMSSDNEFATDNLLFKVVFACALVALDPRCIYSSYIA